MNTLVGKNPANLDTRNLDPILLRITLPLIAGHQPAFAENPELSTVVFYVG